MTAPKLREAVARLIDPIAYQDWPVGGEEPHHDWFDRQRALALADAILTLVSSTKGEWRPIETAPRDGTDILAAFGPRGAWVQCAWDDDDGWCTFNRCWERDTHPRLSGKKFCPTIWVALPAPPPASPVPDSGEEMDAGGV